MKRLFAIVVTIILCLLTVGCGSSKIDVREYGFDEEVTYYKLYSPNPDYTLCDKNEDAEDTFEAICEAEILILNNAYGLDLKRERIDVFYTDNIPKTVYGKEAVDGVEGYYSVELNQVFLDSGLKEDKAKLLGVMAHEAIHYLYATNNDIDKKFFTYRKGDEELGDALIEGLTQHIALNNLYILEKNDYCTGSYSAVIQCYYLNTRITDLLCNYGVKDMPRYYLTNDFDSAREAFNNSVGTINSEHEPFELFENALQMAQKYNDENNRELGMKYTEDAIRLIALSVKNSSADNKKAFLSEFDSLGSFSEEYSKSIHKLLE